MQNEDKHIKEIAGVLLVIAMLLSGIGAMIADLTAQDIVWEFGNMCSVCGCAIMAAKMNRDSYDLVSAGFCLLVVAEGFTIAAVAKPGSLDYNMLGAGLMLYMPGYLLIGIYSRFKWWIRTASVLTCAFFCVEAFFIVKGKPLDTDTFTNLGAFILRGITYVGFAITLFRTRTGEKVY